MWLVASGCRHTFPTEYGLDDLAADSAKWPGDALVHYLSRPDADAAQGCQAGRLARRDDELSGPLVAALSGRGVSPKNWVTCASTLLATLEPFEREGLLTELASRTPALANAPSSVGTVGLAYFASDRVKLMGEVGAGVALAGGSPRWGFSAGFGGDYLLRDPSRALRPLLLPIPTPSSTMGNWRNWPKGIPSLFRFWSTVAKSASWPRTVRP